MSVAEPTTQRFPTAYIPHGGGPCFFMDPHPVFNFDTVKEYLLKLPKMLPTRPKAILVISAHWEENEFTVTTNPKPPLIYDYYGFPAHTYKLKYPAPGAPELANRVCDLLKKANIPCNKDNSRGFDHGVFIPLKVSYPDADIPVIALSLKKGLDAKQHIDVGKALEPLRKENVLILGSGMSFHNLGAMRSRGGSLSISKEFDDWLKSACIEPEEKRNAKLTNWASAPKARDCHPREEHLIPLMVCAGAAGSDLGSVPFSGEAAGAIVSAVHFT